MKILYKFSDVKKQCTNKKTAQKLFGGDNMLAISLLARVNALVQADCIKDIIAQKQFHFHKLKNKNGRNLEGYFAIDVKSRKEQWRIIIEPLDENEEPYNPCNIDVIASKVRIVGIVEVSKHYE